MEKQILELLQQMDKKLTVQGQTLDKHSQILEKHSLILADHGQILNALRHGQESLKAEVSELRLQNAKEFGELKEQIKNLEISNELLKEDNWNNKKDIRKIQKTMGMV